MNGETRQTEDDPFAQFVVEKPTATAEPTAEEDPFAKFAVTPLTPPHQTYYYPETPENTRAAGLSYGMEGGIYGAGEFSNVDLRNHTKEKYLAGESPFTAVATANVPKGQEYPLRLDDGQVVWAKNIDTGGGLQPGQVDVATSDPRLAAGGGIRRGRELPAGPQLPPSTGEDVDPFAVFVQPTPTPTPTAEPTPAAKPTPTPPLQLTQEPIFQPRPLEAPQIQVDPQGRSVPTSVALDAAPEEFPAAQPSILPPPDNSYFDLLHSKSGDMPMINVTPDEFKLAFQITAPNAARSLGLSPATQNAYEGISKSGSALLSGFTTPNNILLMGAMIVAPEITGAEFLVRVASLGVSASSAQNIWNTIHNSTAQPGSVEWWTELADIVSNTALGTLTGVHAFTPKARIGETIREEDLQPEKGPPPRQVFTPKELQDNLREAIHSVTDATNLPPPPPPPVRPPGGGRWFFPTAGKRLIRTPLERWFGNWDAARQTADGASLNMAKSLVQALPDKAKRIAVYNWAAAAGDEGLLRQWANAAPADVKQGYEDALHLTQYEKEIAGIVRDGYDAWLAQARDKKMLDQGVQDYLKRIVTKLPEEAENATRGLFRTGNRLNTSFPEARKRFWEVMVDAEKKGVRYNKDIGVTTFSYARSFTHSAVDRAAVSQLFDMHTEDGRPMIIVEGQGIEVGKDGNTALLVKPFGVRRFPGQADLAKKLQAADPSLSDDAANAKARDQIRQEYVSQRDLKISIPSLEDWQWVDTRPDGTSVMVRGPAMMHKSIAEVMKRKFATERLDWLDKWIVKPVQLVKGSKLSLTIFHDVHERINAAGHLVNSTNVRLLHELMKNPDIRYGMQNGLQLFNSRVDGALLGESMAGKGWIEHTPLVGKWMSHYKSFLFEDYIPRLKAEMYLKALERNRARYQTKRFWRREGTLLNDEQLATLTARQANATFGEQNYRQMLGAMTGHPVFWQMLQTFFLAPDFGYSKLQHITQAFTPYGGEQRMALATVAATLYTGARFMNKLLDGDFHWEPEHAFSVVVGDRTYSLRSLPGDMQHLWSSPLSYSYHRLSFISQLALESLTKRDYYGRPIGWSDIAKDLLLAPVPITVTHLGEQAIPWGKKGHYRMGDMLAAAVGLSVNIYRYETEIRKLALEWKKKQPELQAKIARNQGAVFPPSQYDDLRNALEFDDFKTARGEYQKLLAQGGKMTASYLNTAMKKWSEAPFATGIKRNPKLAPEDQGPNEEAFLKTLTPNQRQLYNNAREARKKVYRNFQLLRETQ